MRCGRSASIISTFPIRLAAYGKRYVRQASSGLLLSEYHRQPSTGTAPRCILYNDLDVAPEAGQTVDQLALGDAAELAAKNAGELRLREAENLGCFRLRQTLAADDFADLGDELRLDEHFLGVREPEIAVDVPAALVDFRSFSQFTFAHLPAPWPAL